LTYISCVIIFLWSYRFVFLNHKVIQEHLRMNKVELIQTLEDSKGLSKPEAEKELKESVDC